jgi:hypothetical protein
MEILTPWILFSTNMWRIIFIVMMIIPNFAFAEVGTVTDFKGNAAEARRDSDKLTVEMGFGIEMLDQLITANTRLGLTFEDGTRVEITEQSKLVIDDFVYDPNTSAGKMSMEVALGTVQMTSGLLAKTSRENVDIRTPTASITVRGTDFSMTVDEIGRSLIILLPSCPDETLNEDECPVGSISVSTEAGTVMLNESYQATMVSHSGLSPADPRKLLLDKSNINNNLIIVPPSEFPGGFSNDEEEEEIRTELDVDLLENEELSEDLLAVEEEFATNTLDVNRVNNTYLDNLLDISVASLESALEEEEKSDVLPNIKNFPWIRAVVNEEIVSLDSDRSPHISMLTTSLNTHGTYNVTQDGISAAVQINDGGTNVSITTIQTQ